MPRRRRRLGRQPYREIQLRLRQGDFDLLVLCAGLVARGLSVGTERRDRLLDMLTRVEAARVYFDTHGRIIPFAFPVRVAKRAARPTAAHEKKMSRKVVVLSERLRMMLRAKKGR